MQETFELYLVHADGSSRFVPLMCNRADLISSAQREMLLQRAKRCTIEQFGRPVLALEAPQEPPEP